MSVKGITEVAAVAGACAALAIAAYSQAASGNGVRTHFSINGTFVRNAPFRLTLYGHLRARKHRCIANRRATLYFNRADKRHLRDTDWSSHNGAIALKGRWHAKPRRFIVKVHKKRIEARHPYTCAHDRWVHQYLKRPPRLQ